ncbi:hypothetical protein [Coleofasciculus chthonoplastes]|uniref:hypothetical protein n=1 Tax=Coleofasciculus chthonoplastes TaxID=64178 RepID=UPI003300C4A0
MSLFLSLSKAISSHQLLGLPDPRAIAFGDGEDCDRAFPFPRYVISPGIKAIPHQSAMEAYPGKHITAQETPFDTAN